MRLQSSFEAKAVSYSHPWNQFKLVLPNICRRSSDSHYGYHTHFGTCRANNPFLKMQYQCRSRSRFGYGNFQGMFCAILGLFHMYVKVVYLFCISIIRRYWGPTYRPILSKRVAFDENLKSDWFWLNTPARIYDLAGIKA